MSKTIDIRKNEHKINIHGNLHDWEGYQNRERRRRLFCFLDMMAIIFGLIGIASLYFRNYSIAIISLIIMIGIIFYFSLRKKIRRSHKHHQ